MVIDKLPKLKVSMEMLAKKELLVGVPRIETIRKDEGMNNATLAYIHNNGSPAQNIPARPFMEPGIEDSKDKVVKIFKLAAQSSIKGNESAVEAGFHKAGLTAQLNIRARINEGIDPPLAASTRAARLRRGRKGMKPLIDTGQLRNSINYIIREKK